MTAAGETGTAAGARDGPPAGPAGAAGAKKHRLPPHAYFLVSAVFHYLGPALAVLLFAAPAASAGGGARTPRNAPALALAVAGVVLLSEVKVVGQPVGLAFSFANCALFTLYIVLGHRIAAAGGSTGIDRLATAMLIAAVAIRPAGVNAGAGAL